MRWSLLLTTLIAILSIHTFLSLAVVTRSKSRLLENSSHKTSSRKTSSNRYGGKSSLVPKKDLIHHASKKSKKKSQVGIVPWGNARTNDYRKTAIGAPDKYDVIGSHVIRTKIVPALRETEGQKKFNDKKLQADHIFEHQMLKTHLRKNGIRKFSKLSPEMRGKVQDIFNAKENLAFISSKLNKAKATSITRGMGGKGHRNPNQLRDSYMKESYAAATETAKKLDDAFKADPKYKHMAGFEDRLHQTMRNLGFSKPDASSTRSGKVYKS